MKTFWVAGKPIGQGRISYFNGRGVHSNAKILKPWRETIQWSAKSAKLELIPKNEPVWLELQFVFERGKTVTRKHHTIPPDLDHLIRAVKDSLTGIAYEDDSQVTSVSASKVYWREETKDWFPGKQGVLISVGNIALSY